MFVKMLPGMQEQTAKFPAYVCKFALLSVDRFSSLTINGSRLDEYNINGHEATTVQFASTSYDY